MNIDGRRFSFTGKRCKGENEEFYNDPFKVGERNHMSPRESLTTKEVARYLRVNEYTVYRLVTQRKLPGVKVGSQWRFKLSALERWLEGQLNPPREQ
jgi:excisionase family DNA binding protein